MNLENGLGKRYRVSSLLIACLLPLLFTSCILMKPGSWVENSWHDSGFVGSEFNTLLVVGISDDVNVRKQFEEALTEKILQLGGKGIAAHTLMAEQQPVNKETLLAAIGDRQVDAILVGRILAVAQRIITRERFVGRESAYRNLGHEQKIDVDPEAFREIEEVFVDTKLYETTNAKLIWQVQSGTAGGTGLQEIVDSISQLLTKDLVKHDLIHLSGTD